MSDTFPRAATEVWETSDGKLHTSKAAADATEARLAEQREHRRLLWAVLAAVQDLQFTNFGSFQMKDAMDERFLRALAKRLVDHGLVFAPSDKETTR